MNKRTFLKCLALVPIVAYTPKLLGNEIKPLSEKAKKEYFELADIHLTRWSELIGISRKPFETDGYRFIAN